MSIYQFSVNNAQSQSIPLESFAGKVVLIVNTASKCGFTPQFEELEWLFQKYQEQDFVVLGFPCNQFLHQDPKSNQEILDFCQLNYGVTFPMFAKLQVKGKKQDPLFRYLVEQTGGKAIPWNFTKFLIDRQGNVSQRFTSKETPRSFESEIQALL